MISLRPPKGKRAALTRPPLGNIQMVIAPQVLNEVVSSRESFVANARAVRHATRIFWSPDTVHCRLMALQIGQARKLCVRRAARDIAGPCSAVVGVRWGE
jgi:hypothetical protein